MVAAFPSAVLGVTLPYPGTTTKILYTMGLSNKDTGFT